MLINKAMLRIKNWLIIASVMILSCCRSESHSIEDGTMVLDMDLGNLQQEEIKSSEYFSDVKRVILELTDESIIQMIHHFFFVDNKYLVINERKEFLYFDEDGRFLNKFSRHGQGPGEYVGLSFVFFDNIDNRIIVVDKMSGKLIYYTPGGEFIREVKIPGVNEIINLDNGNFLVYNHQITQKDVSDKLPSGIVELDSLGNIIREIKKQDKRHGAALSFGNSRLQRMHTGEILVKEVFPFSIGKYKDGSYETVTSFHIPDHPLKYGIEKEQEMLVELMSSTRLTFLIPLKNNILLCWDKPSKSDISGVYYSNPSYMFYNLDNRQFRYAKEIINDIPCVGSPMDTNRTDVVVYTASALGLVNMRNRFVAEGKHPAEYQWIMDMSEDDVMSMNPVVDILTIR